MVVKRVFTPLLFAMVVPKHPSHLPWFQNELRPLNKLDYISLTRLRRSTDPLVPEPNNDGMSLEKL